MGDMKQMNVFLPTGVVRKGTITGQGTLRCITQLWDRWFHPYLHLTDSHLILGEWFVTYETTHSDDWSHCNPTISQKSHSLWEYNRSPGTRKYSESNKSVITTECNIVYVAGGSTQRCFVPVLFYLPLVAPLCYILLHLFIVFCSEGREHACKTSR